MSLRMLDRQNLAVIVHKDEFVRVEVFARDDASEVAEGERVFERGYVNRTP